MSRINLFYIIIFCFCAAFFSIGCKKSGEPFSGPPNDMKRYPYERFHLTYEYSGDVRGIEELFVSGYGKYEARHSKIEVFSAQGLHASDNGSITRVSDMYTVDFLLRNAVHAHLRPFDSLYHLDPDEIPSPQVYFESEMKRNYFKNVGIDTVAGRPATRWQHSEGNTILWVWNGLLLRKYASSDKGSLDMKIKEIDTLWTVDTSKFMVPIGFQVIEAENLKHAPNSN